MLHLSCFWLLGCGNIALSLFRTVPWLAWSPGLSQNTSSKGLCSKKIMFYYQTFFSSSNMFFIRLFLANTWKKIWGHGVRLREKENLFRYHAWGKWGKSLTFCTCTRPYARAGDAKIVRSRGAQCNTITKELPYLLTQNFSCVNMRNVYNKRDGGFSMQIAICRFKAFNMRAQTYMYISIRSEMETWSSQL